MTKLLVNQFLMGKVGGLNPTGDPPISCITQSNAPGKRSCYFSLGRDRHILHDDETS